MRGYLSFIVAFASILLVLAFVQLNSRAGEIDLSQAIAAERAYQAQMNAKEVLIEAARQGGINGYSLYAGSHSYEECVRYCADMGHCLLPGNGPCNPLLCEAKCFRVADAQEAAEQGALENMSAAGGFDPEVGLLVWCGPEPSGSEAASLASSMRSRGSVVICDGCYPISSRECAKYLTASVTPDHGGGTGSLDYLQFAPRSGKGVIGISAHYGRFGIASASYLPMETGVDFR